MHNKNAGTYVRTGTVRYYRPRSGDVRTDVTVPVVWCNWWLCNSLGLSETERATEMTEKSEVVTIIF